MKKTQKRICGNCKAHRTHIYKAGGNHYCALGYKVIDKKISYVPVDAIPQEPCEKPTTWSQYYALEPIIRKFM